MVVAILAGLPIMMGVQKVTSGENPETERADALLCDSTSVVYPKIELTQGVLGHVLNVRTVYSDGALKTLGLYYDLELGSREQMKSAYESLVAGYNTTLAGTGMDAQNRLNVKYTQNNNSVGVSLFVRVDDIVNGLRPFLMISDGTKLTKDELKKDFERQGLKCQTTAE